MTDPEASRWFSADQPSRDSKRDTRRLPPPPKPTRGHEETLEGLQGKYDRAFDAAIQTTLDQAVTAFDQLPEKSRTLLTQLIVHTAMLPRAHPMSDQEYHAFAASLPSASKEELEAGMRRLPRDWIEQLFVYAVETHRNELARVQRAAHRTSLAEVTTEAALRAFHQLYGRIFEAAAKRTSLEAPLPDLTGMPTENQTLLQRLIEQSAYLPHKEPFATPEAYRAFIDRVHRLPENQALHGFESLSRDALEQLAVQFARTQAIVEVQETAPNRQQSLLTQPAEATIAQAAADFAQKGRLLIEDYEGKLREQKVTYESKGRQLEAQYRDSLGKLTADFTRERDALAAQKDSLVSENERLKERAVKAERLLAEKTAAYTRLEQPAAKFSILEFLLAAKTTRIDELQQRLSTYEQGLHKLTTEAPRDEQ